MPFGFSFHMGGNGNQRRTNNRNQNNPDAFGNQLIVIGGFVLFMLLSGWI